LPVLLSVIVRVWRGAEPSAFREVVCVVVDAESMTENP
jgi:hypothetical protein